jgi:hypothetical protein
MNEGYKIGYKPRKLKNLKKTIGNYEKKFAATATFGPYSKKNVLSRIGLLFKE